MEKFKEITKKIWLFDWFVDIKGVSIPVGKSILVIFILGALIF